MHRVGRVLGWVVAVGVVVAGCGSDPPPPIPRTALIYGDSLLAESQPALARAAAQHPDWHVEVQAWFGSAPCHWRERIGRDLARVRPSVVVIETAGNPPIGCPENAAAPVPRPGSKEMRDAYAGDLSAMVEAARHRGARVILLTPPPVADPTRNRSNEGITAIEHSLASDGIVRVDDSARDALGGNTYTPTLPCLPSESAAQGCTNGRITVREPLGLHFCPRGYVSLDSFLAGCPVYSSGAVRFGTAILDATVRTGQ